MTLGDMPEKVLEVLDLNNDMLYVEMLVVKFFTENREYIDDFPIVSYIDMIEQANNMIVEANNVLYLHILKEMKMHK